MSTLAKLMVVLGLDSSEFSSGIGKAENETKGLGGILKTAAGTAIGFVGAAAGMSVVSSALGFVKDSAFGMNASLEKSTLQFTTLMGNSDAAAEHVRGLFDFAAKTPFETGPIIEASRIMHTFGGDALDTKANLTLFGDAAAATSQPINDIAFWMSRAYAAIQGGQPFGEARMRLMEMGVLTPEVANKLEQLSKSGASASDQWNALTGSLSKFNGAMALQANTWEGLTSSISDNMHILAAQAFKPLFDLAKTGFSSLLTWLGQLQESGAIEAFGQSLATSIKWLMDLGAQAIPLVVNGFNQLYALVKPVF